jgi:AcrR family transcriptional regulator
LEANSLENTTYTGTKERIIKASVKLFSEKGFDATRVSEIADTANVNKVLIYYYFKSKEDILDYMVHSIFHNAVSITMDFIHTNIVQMVKDGRLDIKPDRLHFVDEEAIGHFLQNSYLYYERVTDFAIEHRHIFRILLFESLKSGKHHNDLFRLMEFSKDREDNPIFKTISEADRDFNYSEDIVLFKFFFSIMPLVSFAAYFDDYKKISLLSDAELRSSFLRSYQIISSSLVYGSDILLRNNTINK